MVGSEDIKLIELGEGAGNDVSTDPEGETMVEKQDDIIKKY